MQVPDEVLITRALNYTRRIHVPTYMGLRLIAKQFPNNPKSNLIGNFVRHKLKRGADPRFHGFQILKSMGDKTAYRDAWIGSPSEMLVETWLLKQLEPLTPSPNVYSYLWPSTVNAGQIYHYFIHGYAQRNREIAELLSHSEEDLAVYITDVERFYPSVSHEVLRTRVYQLLGNVLSHDIKSGAIQLVESLLELNGRLGIPIGPPLSHWLGHVAMSSVDEILGAEFGNTYFRYVDDIVIVCSKANGRRVAERVEGTLSQEGFALNPDKTMVISGQEWLRGYRQTTTVTEMGSTFNDLVENLIGYFILHTEDERNRLKRLFRDHGFSMPFFSIESRMKYNRFLAWLGYRISSGKLRRWLSVEEMLRVATRLRRDLLGELESTSSDVLSGRMDRRWYVQRMRFLLGRLLYMIPISEYKFVRDLIPNLPELRPFKVLMQSLLNRSPEIIYELGGQFASVFSTIWRENELGTIKVDLDTVTPAHFDTLQVLLLYGVCEAASLNPHMSKEKYLSYMFCLGRSSILRELDDLSYVDELNSLQLGTSTVDFKSLLDSRFNRYEDYWWRPLDFAGPDDYGY